MYKMVLLPTIVALLMPLFWVPSESATPLLETNSPPYTLVNFALEVDPRIDQIGEIQKQASVQLDVASVNGLQQNRKTRLSTQFNQRRKWLDAQFNNLENEQRQVMSGRRHLLAAIRPSGLTVRMPRAGILDDSRNVDTSLKSIRKELGIQKTGTNACTAEARDLSFDAGNRIQSTKINLINRLHRNIWLAMKKRDKPQFECIEKHLKSSNLELNGVSYTLLIHAHLLFNGPGSHGLTQILQEMKEHGVHPSLIRFNARIMASCEEMANLNAKPMAANIVHMTRASWLMAVLVTRRYPRTGDIAKKDPKLDEEMHDSI